MATKAQIQSIVIEQSGRQDLTDSMYSGLTKFDFFLGAALKLLDLAQRTPESKRWLMKDVAIGEHVLQFQNARVIHEVWVANSDGRHELEKKTLHWIKTNYSDALADITTGAPLYYAPDVIHLAPQQKNLTSEFPAISPSVYFQDEFTYDYNNIMFGASYGYNGIVWMPPVDEVYTVEILGDFYSLLEADGDSNFWSVQYPNVLVQAILFSIEVYYRNTAGMNDYLNSLKPFLKGIDDNIAEQDSMNLNQMEG